jgi:hypothetical protein
METPFLKGLALYIGAELERRPFCVVFEDALKHCSPSNETTAAERNIEIQRFAESHGWSATILENAFGTRAIFQRREPDAVDYGRT